MGLSDRLRFSFFALLFLFLIVYSLVERQYSNSGHLVVGDLCAVSNVTPHWSHVVIVQYAEWDERYRLFRRFQGVEAAGGDISRVRTFNDARYINRYQYHQVLRWAN